MYIHHGKVRSLYPDLDPDYEEEQIVERFKTGQFPNIKYSSMSHIFSQMLGRGNMIRCVRCWETSKLYIRKGLMLMAEGVEEKVYN